MRVRANSKYGYSVLRFFLSFYGFLFRYSSGSSAFRCWGASSLCVMVFRFRNVEFEYMGDSGYS